MDKKQLLADIKEAVIQEHKERSGLNELRAQVELKEKELNDLKDQVSHLASGGFMRQSKSSALFYDYVVLIEQEYDNGDR